MNHIGQERKLSDDPFAAICPVGVRTELAVTRAAFVRAFSTLTPKGRGRKSVPIQQLMSIKQGGVVRTAPMLGAPPLSFYNTLSLTLTD